MCLSHTYWTDQQKSLLLQGILTHEARGVTPGGSQSLKHARAFADDMSKFLQTTASSQPDLKPYLDNLAQIVQQIPNEYNVQKENIKSLEYADELSRKTLALLQKKDPKNLQACLDLGKDWRGMGGARMACSRSTTSSPASSSRRPAPVA